MGRVADVSTDRHAAEVDVLAVWKGPDLPATVEVRGGYAGDVEQRRYNEGAVYLFFPGNRRAPFVDDVCTATRLYSGPQLVIPPYLADAAGSETARLPLGSEPEQPAPSSSMLAAVVIILLVLLTFVGVLGLYQKTVRVTSRRAPAPADKPIFKPVRKGRRQQKVRAYTATGSRAARRHAKAHKAHGED